jgi:hypothetical protein
MNDLIYEDSPEKVVPVFESLMINKSRIKAIEICKYHEKKKLETLLNDKFKLLKYLEEETFLSNNEDKNVEFNSSAFKTELKKEEDSNSNTINNPLQSFAINFGNMKDIEEEVRNELGYDEEGKSPNIEEINNPVNVKTANVNLEKKNVTIYFKFLRVIHFREILIVTILNKI